MLKTKTVVFLVCLKCGRCFSCCLYSPLRLSLACQSKCCYHSGTVDLVLELLITPGHRAQVLSAGFTCTFESVELYTSPPVFHVGVSSICISLSIHPLETCRHLSAQRRSKAMSPRCTPAGTHLLCSRATTKHRVLSPDYVCVQLLYCVCLYGLTTIHSKRNRAGCWGGLTPHHATPSGRTLEAQHP